MAVDTLWYDTATDKTTAKDELDITDALDDTLIDDYGLKANRKIDNLVFPILDTIPTTESAEITIELKEAAIFDIARRFKRVHKNFESAKDYKENFDEIIESVLRRAKAAPTTRQQRIARSIDYDTETELFSQSLR